MIVLDQFLMNFRALKNLNKTAQFADVINPYDGVTYPHIFRDIPEDIESDVLENIERAIGFTPRDAEMFMRRSPEGVAVPHIFHNDISMSKYSLMLYLNDHPGGGTGFAKYKADKAIKPASENVDSYAADANNREAWHIYKRSEMKENRALIFDADLFHCALPIGGFGAGVNARTVLTCFFNRD